MSENNDGYFDVYDAQEVNDLQENGQDNNQIEQNPDDQVKRHK